MQKDKADDLSFQLEGIGEDRQLLIDPDNVFWTVLFKKKLERKTCNNIFSLYERNKKSLDSSMREFRFKTDINSVYINPTDKCNADCPYCYIPKTMRKNGRSLTEGELEYILNKINDYFISLGPDNRLKPVIIYHGSEPLLVKDIIFSSIEKFKDKFDFGIQTNTILLEKKDVKFLKDNKVSVGISLDSLDPRVNANTRKSSLGSNYEKAIKTIDWFKGYEGLSVITTVTKYNVKDLSQVVRYMHNKQVSCLLLNPVRTTRKATEKLRPKHEDLTKYFLEAVKEAINLNKKSKRPIIIGNFSNIVLGIVAPMARRLMCDISPCGGARCFFAITANGDMIPCGEFIGIKEFRGGNIFRSSIKDAIDSKAFKNIRSRVVEKISECDVCNFRNICGAPCPAEAYSIHNDLNVKSPYCEFYKEIIKYAFELISKDEINFLFREDAFKKIKYEYELNMCG